MSPDKITYKRYLATARIIGQIEGGVPKNAEMIKTWLETKGVSKADIYQDTLAAMGKEEAADGAEAAQADLTEKNWCGFKCGDRGLYIEARQIKAAFKEAANVCKGMIGLTAARSKLAERVWIRGIDNPEAIWLGTEKPDGTEERVVHAMTRRGPISSIKRTDYVNAPTLEFELEVLNDGTFTEETLRELLVYMGKNGIGANRSQSAGQFELVSFGAMN